jgi:gas vesicle protein
MVNIHLKKIFMKIQKTVGTFLIGAAIGVVAGILYAPNSGKKTRRKIINQKDDMMDMMKVKLHGVLEDMKDKLENTAEKAIQFLEIEKALNAKIMKLTLKIQDECPELTKYIEEMPNNSFTSTDTEITLRNLQAYALSLETMHKKYLAEHPIPTKAK